MEFNVKNIVVKILQGSVATQTMLGGLTIHPRVANFLQCICAKNYENWLAVDKVIAKISRLTFFGPPCYSFSAPGCLIHCLTDVMHVIM